MPQIRFKLTDKNYQELKNYSAQNGMKLTEAVRYFVSTGLATSLNINQQLTSDKSITLFEQKIGEYTLESLVLIRKMIEILLDNNDKIAKETINDAAIRAQNHVKKILDDSSNFI
jgi:hypothetical protein